MRDIDWEKPLSEEDAKWVEGVGTKQMRAKLKQNRERFESVESAASDEDEPQDEYDEMNLDQLKAEAKDRKEQDPDFDTTGIKNKGQLIARLREWDKKQQQEEE